MAERGYLVIADITGYTAFLSGSELEHAESSLKDLLNLIIEQTKPPLVISRLEGDAVISYAPEASFLQGQTMVEIIENTYVKFREARQRMRLNTTCTCNACQNIPNLDLKFFVHHGTYVLQKIAHYTELVGNDVNVVHRLLKNHIKEKTGVSAYAAYTQAAVDALGIHEFVVEMQEHTELFPDVGEVKLYVEDLEPVWQRESKRRRVFVDLEDAWFINKTEIPAEPPLAWDYFTKPEYRMVMMGSDSMEVNDKNAGRMDEGAVYVCAHGDAEILQPVLDWRPFKYYTYEMAMPGGLMVLITTRFIPIDGGTRVLGLCSKPQGSIIARNMAKLMRGKAQAESQKGFDALREVIVQELNIGAAVRPEASIVPADQVTAAARASLAEAGAH
ncbi:MAG: DUF2652 domain-containing protein [Chloroflexi bacterium]|nr:DUF2652 domain-containing protein [Chloroflexota bacterium]